jgi:hypothetical protein
LPPAPPPHELKAKSRPTTATSLQNMIFIFIFPAK